MPGLPLFSWNRPFQALFGSQGGLVDTQPPFVKGILTQLAGSVHGEDGLSVKKQLFLLK